jgi:predicted Rossmann fold nucleotide-binding protein DprA/Smf involved in DNA uptake
MLKDDLHKNRDVIKMPVGDADDMNDGVHPYISNGSTLVPARFVVEKLDADIQWNGETQQVTVIDPFSHRKIVLAIGSNQATVDGKATTLETAAELTNSSTFVPVRFIAEALGCKVEWDDKTRTVIITREAD